MLLTKTVKIKWNPKHKKYYEELGYTYTKMGDEFEVKVEDLAKNSNVKVEYICDNCGDIHNIKYQSYNKKIKKNNKSYCMKCSKKVLGVDKTVQTILNKKQNYFAQKLIEECGDNALDLYWDYEKNTVNPWKISVGSDKSIWIKCQKKDYHGSYETTPKRFFRGHRCPFCRGLKTHKLDSIGQYVIDNYNEEFLWKIWSDKNDISPFKVSCGSGKKAWWNCPDNKHESFKRSCYNSIIYEFRCPKCVEELGHSVIEEKTRLYLEELGYEVKTEYKCSLIPINPKTSHPLPFDNEITLENGKHLIIEVHGSQHYYKVCNNSKFLEKGQTPEEYLYQRKLYDRYKKIKCIQAGYEYLELPYWEFNEKDNYKKLIEDKIVKITIERTMEAPIEPIEE